LLNLSKSEILLRLYSRLKQSPCTIDILVDWKNKNGFTFHDRSLYRYLNELANNLAIQGETIDVSTNEKNKKVWKLVYDNSGNELSLFDINTFFLTKNFVPKSIIQNRKESFAKIEKILYQQQSKNKFELNVEANQLMFDTTNFYDVTYTALQQQKIEELIWAIQNKRKIILKDIFTESGVFQGSFADEDIILPLSLKQHRGVLQLCCFAPKINDVFILSYDTLISFEITNDTFNPKKYTKLLNDYFATHFGITPNINNHIYQIEVEFTNATGVFVKQFFWHSSQKWTTLKNGNYLLKLTCGINRELVGWIFQWMSNAKINKPALLKKMVIDKHKDCINILESKKPPQYNNSFLKK
jgi:hypothetical protein